VIVAFPTLHCFTFTTNRKPTASPQQNSTTSCTTSSKSHNKLDNWSHSKSTTKSTASCMQRSASLTLSRTTCCTTNPQVIEVMEFDT